MLEPVRSIARPHAIVHLGLIAALLVAAVALIATPPGTANAQSATPVAAGDCAPPPPAMAPDVPETQISGTPAATPAPVTRVDQATESVIHEVIDSLAACLTAGNAETVTTLVTERYLGDAYGGGERMTRDDYVALAPMAPVVPVTVVSVGEIVFSGDDTATTRVVTIQGKQLRTEDWTFLFVRSRTASATPTVGEGAWLVHQVTLLPSTAPDGASSVEVVQDGESIEITPGNIEGPDVAFSIKNTSDATHEFLVLRLANGATIDELIRPTSDTFPANIEVIGQKTIPAGETSPLVLVDLEPGTYTVVCLLPDLDGVPHLALGETTTFTVE